MLRIEKAVKHKGDGDTSWYAWNGPQKLEKRTGGIGNQRKNQDHPDYSIDTIS